VKGRRGAQLQQQLGRQDIKARTEGWVCSFVNAQYFDMTVILSRKS
jgi:hypothetical protein